MTLEQTSSPAESGRLSQDYLVTSAIKEFDISESDQAMIAGFDCWNSSHVSGIYHNFFMEFTGYSDPEQGKAAAIRGIERIHEEHAARLAAAEEAGKETDVREYEQKLGIDNGLLHLTQNYGPEAAFRIARAIEHLDNH